MSKQNYIKFCHFDKALAKIFDLWLTKCFYLIIIKELLKYKEAKLSWKEHINQRKDKEAKFMVSDKEWEPKAEEMFWKEEEIVEEKNSQLNTKERVDHRLKKNKHFGYIYKKGKRKSTKNFTLFAVPSKFKTYKIGISVSKKQGKANKRNKLKRRLKEIVRTQNLPQNYFNYVLLAREGAAELSFEELKEQVIKLFKVWKF